MIDYLRQAERAKLVEILGEHIRPSKDAYLRLAGVRWSRLLE